MRTHLKFGVLRQYFVWNVLMIVVIIGLIGLVLVSMITNMVEREMSDIHVQRMTYVNSIIELGVLQPAENIVLEQLFMPQNLDVRSHYSHLETHLQLRKLIALLPFVESLNIYYPQDRMLISSRGIKYDYEAMDTSELTSAFTKDQAGHKKWFLFNEEANPTFDRAGDIISYAGASALKQNEEPVFIFYINLYSRYISTILQSQLIHTNEAIIIHNDENEIVVQSNSSASYAKSMVEDVFETGQTADAQLNMRELDGQQVMLLNYTSRYNDWTYTLIMPMNDFFRVSSYIQNIIIYVSLGALIVGLLFAIFVTINQYKPVNALRILVNKSRLNQLLRGIIDDESNSEISNLLHEEYCIVVAFQLKEARINESVFTRLKSAIVESGLMSDNQVLVTSYTKDIIVVVINFGGSQQVVLDRIERVSTLFAATLTSPICVGAGTVVQGVEQLHDSCNQALRALKQHFLVKDKSLVLYSRDLVNQGELRIPELYRQLVHAFEVNHVQEIYRLLDSLIAQLTKRSYRMESVELVIHQMMQLVTQKMMEIEPKSGESMLVYRNVPEEFYRKADVFEALEWLKSLVGDLFSMEVDENTNHILMQNVKNYIDHHYDEEISLELLSQKTFISASYISALFKKTFHIGVSEYVSDLRMEKAKELLQSGNWKIEEIARQVGMTNSTYFITRFKRRFGMTPNQYKQHVRLSEIKESKESKES